MKTITLNFKYLIYVIIAVNTNLVSVFSQTFTKLNTGNTTGFNSVSFSSENNGYAVGGKTILKTNNGGNSWVLANSPANLNMWTVCAVGNGTTENIFAAGEGNILYKSSDGGITWHAQNSGFLNNSNTFIFGIYAKDVDNCYLMGGDDNSGAIVKTSNSGTNWGKINVSGAFFLEKCSFIDANLGFAVGADADPKWNGVIAKTTNGGSTWTLIKSVPELLNSISCPNANTCYASATDGVILKTTNGGNTWEEQNSGTTQSLLDIKFLNANTGYIAGVAGTLLKTSNGGNTWTDIYSGTENLNSVCITPGGSSIFVSGGDGTILKASAPTAIEETKGETNLTVYPNPFTESSIITVDAKNVNANELTFILYDLTGRCVKTQSIMSSGYNHFQAEITRENLSAGMYFFRITAIDGALATGKLTVE